MMVLLKTGLIFNDRSVLGENGVAHWGRERIIMTMVN